MTQEHTLTAWPLSRGIRLAELARMMPGTVDHRTSDLVSADLPPSARLYAFDFGALCLLSPRGDDVQPVLDALPGELAELVDRERADTFAVAIDPSLRERVAWDHAWIREGDLPRLDVLALVLAQSVALERTEREVDEVLDRSRALCDGLERTGIFPRDIKEIYRFIGHAMVRRHDLIARFYLIDRPESTWDDPSLEALYDQTCAAFDLRERYHALEAELALIQDTLALLAESVTSQRMTRLEWIVVILIAIEIPIFLFEAVWR